VVWEIVVVDRLPRPWPSAKSLVQRGVPLKVAARYATVRRQMSPKGLARKARAQRN
jgi:hypothetical protein